MPCAKLTLSFVASSLLSAVIGCGNEATDGRASRSASAGESSKDSVSNDGNKQPSGKINIGAGESISPNAVVDVSGTFDLVGPDAPLRYVTVKVVSVAPNGEETTRYSANAMAERESDNRGAFSCRVTAPSRPGEYAVRAMYEGKSVAERPFKVGPQN